MWTLGLREAPAESGLLRRFRGCQSIARYRLSRQSRTRGYHRGESATPMGFGRGAPAATVAQGIPEIVRQECSSTTAWRVLGQCGFGSDSNSASVSSTTFRAVHPCARPVSVLAQTALAPGGLSTDLGVDRLPLDALDRSFHRTSSPMGLPRQPGNWPLALASTTCAATATLMPRRLASRDPEHWIPTHWSDAARSSRTDNWSMGTAPGVREATSVGVARELQSRGVRVAVIKGGLRAWKGAGSPVEAVPPEEMAALPSFR